MRRDELVGLNVPRQVEGYGKAAGGEDGGAGALVSALEASAAKSSSVAPHAAGVETSAMAATTMNARLQIKPSIRQQDVVRSAEEYMTGQVEPILDELVVYLCLQRPRPKELPKYIVEWLVQKKDGKTLTPEPDPSSALLPLLMPLLLPLLFWCARLNGRMVVSRSSTVNGASAASRHRSNCACSSVSNSVCSVRPPAA